MEEPGLRSTGHWCRLSTWLLPVSHGGCTGTGPTHETLQPQFIHIYRDRERNVCLSDENSQNNNEKSSVNQDNDDSNVVLIIANSRCRFIHHLQNKRCEHISHGPVFSKQKVKVKLNVFIFSFLDNVKTVR